VIWYNSHIISILNYTNSYLASQVWARGIPKKDISMLRKRFLSPITLKRSTRVIC
jgi:hypothetical protein